MEVDRETGRQKGRKRIEENIRQSDSQALPLRVIMMYK